MRINTEVAEGTEDTEKREKNTGLKTGHYKSRAARLRRRALQGQEGTNGDAVQDKYTDV
jgi:hypothetical protein